MYLKRLEIYGFKSFADKVVIDFLPNTITTIVGPNGCGKSNIIDAIKWVLGEQSAKSLRCSRMEDLIFNGSETRPPSSLAEVSITFDNTDNTLPLDFTEITITRRMYRSGESEYFINKVPARLKDIKELFLDTGMGEEGYSFIDQGRIDYILIAKPEERRKLFEEAAGVSRYEARKEEALNKLNKVENDLARVNDLISVYKEQLRGLELAVKKAKQYKKAEEELKALEVYLLLRNHGEMQEKCAELYKEREEILAEITALNTEINKLDTNLIKMRSTLTEKEEEVINLQNTRNEASNALIRREEKINSLRHEIENCTQRIKENEDKILTNEREIEEIENRIKTLESVLLDAKEKLKTLEGTLLEESPLLADSKDVQDRIGSLKNEISALQKKQIILVEKKLNLDKELAALVSNLSHTKLELDSIIRERDIADEENNNIRANIDKLVNEIQEIDNRIEENVRKVVALEDERNKINEELYGFGSKINELQKKYNVLLGKENIYEEWEKNNLFPYEGAKSIIESKLPGIEGTVGSLVEFREEKRDLIRAFLGEKLYYLVSDTYASAVNAIKWLQERGGGEDSGGWVNIIVKEKVLQSDKAHKECIFDEYIIGDDANRCIIRYLTSSVLFDENAGVFVSDDCIVCGGSYNSMKLPLSGMLDINKQREALREERENIALELNALLKVKEEKEGRLKEINTNIEVLKNLIERDKFSKENLSKEKEELEKDLLLSEEERRVILREIDKKRMDIEQYEISIRDLEGKISEISNELSSIANEIESKNNEHDSLTHAFQDMLMKRDSMNLEFVEMKQKIVSYEKEIESYLDKKQNLEALNLSLRDEIKYMSEKIEKLSLQIAEEKKEIDGINSQIEEITNKISEVKEMIEFLKVEIKEEEEKVKGYRVQADVIEGKLNNIEKNISVYEADISHIKDTLNKLYGFSEIEGAENFVKSVVEVEKLASEEIDTINEQISRLRKRVENLGSVNLAAPEEFEQLQARVAFLMAQRDDLINSKNDLIQLIHKITVNTKQQFKEVFMQVRQNFKEVFSVLFEGGEADLVLLDEEDVLNSGIEIIARPPGRRTRSISLLSGGERALTALALLFAFFLVKPAPICLLDEVDAPLDDISIHRYSNLLKKFSEKLQLLIITHNKKTAQVGSIFHGITMEEPGVSKVISVKYTSFQEGAREGEPTLVESNA
jgi:chromosome segregation protein